MTFVDTNVFMYAVGNPHPLQGRARAFFNESRRNRVPLCTSAEVLQEIAHAYLPVGRRDAFDDALSLVAMNSIHVWPLEAADVALARQLHEQHPNLAARDLCHLACCRRRGVGEIMTFDRALAGVFGNPSLP